MEPKANGQGFTMSTGRELSACGCVIGISPDLRAHEGHDGSLGEFDPVPLTRAEQHDIANYMIGLWAAWWAERER